MSSPDTPPTKSAAEREIYNVARTKEGTVDLDERLGNDEIPSQLWTMATHITCLQLRYNSLSSLSPFISCLSHLQQLYLGSNCLTTVPDELTRLTSLQTLDLGFNRFDKLPSIFTKLTSLSALDLNDNKFGRFPNELFALTALDSLSLSYNKISSIPPRISSLTNLSNLLVDHNKLTSLPKEIGQLTNLRRLHAEYNLIESIPDEIDSLTKLEFLIINNNRIEKTKNLPSKLTGLRSLKELALQWNKLTLLPSCLADLPVNVTLRLAYNEWESETEQQLCNAKLSTEPCNVRAVQRHIRNEEEQEAVRHLRVMFVGDTTAGKTTMVKRLLGDDDYASVAEENRTIGVIVRNLERNTVRFSMWDFALERNTVRFSMWDFAGQEAYYQFHRLFLSDRCVYVLVIKLTLLTADKEAEKAMERVKWWLMSIVRKVGKNSRHTRFILVGTHWDKVKRVVKVVEDNFKKLEEMIKKVGTLIASDKTGWIALHQPRMKWNLLPALDQAAEDLIERLPLKFLGVYNVLTELADEIVAPRPSADDSGVHTSLKKASTPPVMSWGELRKIVRKRVQKRDKSDCKRARELAAFKEMDETDWMLCAMRLAHLGLLFYPTPLLDDPDAIVCIAPAWLAQVIGELIEFALVDPPSLPANASKKAQLARPDRMNRTEAVRKVFENGVLALADFHKVWKQLGSQFNTDLGSDDANEKKRFVLRALQEFEICHEVKVTSKSSSGSSVSISSAASTSATASTTKTDTYFLFPCMLPKEQPKSLKLDKDIQAWHATFQPAEPTPIQSVVYIDFIDKSVHGEHIVQRMLFCQVRDLEGDDSVIVRDRWTTGFTMRAQYRNDKHEKEFVKVCAEQRGDEHWRLVMRCDGRWNRWWQATSLGYWVAKWLDEACESVLGATRRPGGLGSVGGSTPSSSRRPSSATSTSTSTSTSTLASSSSSQSLFGTGSMAPNGLYSISVDCWLCAKDGTQQSQVTVIELPRMWMSAIDVKATVAQRYQCKTQDHEKKTVDGYLTIDHKVVADADKEMLKKALIDVLVKDGARDRACTLPPFDSDTRTAGAASVANSTARALVPITDEDETNRVTALFSRLCGAWHVDVQKVWRVENADLYRTFAVRRSKLGQVYGNDAIRAELMVHYTDEDGANGIAKTGFCAQRALDAHAWFGKGFYFSTYARYGGMRSKNKFADYAREIKEFWHNSRVHVVERTRRQWSKPRQAMVDVVEWRKGGDSQWTECQGRERLKLTAAGDAVMLGNTTLAQCVGAGARFDVKTYIDVLLCVVITGRRRPIQSGHAQLPDRGDFKCQQDRNAHESHPIHDGKGETVVCVRSVNDEERSAQVLPRYVVRFWPREDFEVKKAT